MAPGTLAYRWYRPWSRELHYTALYHLFGARTLPFHIACFALYLAAMGLFFVLARRVAGAGARGGHHGRRRRDGIVGRHRGVGLRRSGLWMLVWALVTLAGTRARRSLLAMIPFALALQQGNRGRGPRHRLRLRDAVRRRERTRGIPSRSTPRGDDGRVGGVPPALGGRWWWAASLPTAEVHTNPLA